MKYQFKPPRRKNAPEVKGVYADLQDLVKIQHKGAGSSFLPRQPIHSLLSGRHASRMRGRGLNFEEIRRYLPGDDIRNMDWKVTARTKKAHTRVYTEERDRPAILVVDQRLSMFFGTQVNMKSVTATEAAALGAWRVFSAGDRVGALVFSDTDIVEIRAHRSRKRVMRILETIVDMNHGLNIEAGVPPNPGMLNEVLERAVRLAKHDYLVAVISDFDGADEETRGHMLRMAQHNDVLAVLVHDPSATNLPPTDNLVVTDGELQIEVQAGQECVRKRVAEYSTGRIARILEWQKEIGVPVLPINTAEGVAEQVRHLLGRLPLTGRRRSGAARMTP